MKPPSKKRAGRDIPDQSKEELLEQIGGSDGETAEEEESREQGLEGDEGGGGYGRPREQGDDDQPA